MSVISVPCNHTAEWTLPPSAVGKTGTGAAAPIIEFTEPGGRMLRVPAFRDAIGRWIFRYASPVIGRHHWRLAETASTAGNGICDVVPYTGDHPLYKHGPLKVAESRRHLEHADGTPFFWLADTWWMGLCKRLQWPYEFQDLADQRANLGFSVIQIVVGPYPDMEAFDPRGANEAGHSWTPDFGAINPAYFDLAEERIRYLVAQGLVPCILGAWGYHLKTMGVAKMREHWSHLVARFGSYPVVWCLAGEGAMPYYNSTDRAGETAFLKEGWTQVARHVKHIDPYQHPMTIHPTDTARTQLLDPSPLDFDMLQTGHGDRRSIPDTMRAVAAARAATPGMPFLNGEVCYEGIGESCRQEIQRQMFWLCVLGGACGHSYGANGIWQVNRKEEPYGPSPHGGSWGDTPWDTAARLPGACQLGLSVGLLRRYPWWKFQSQPEWVEPSATAERVHAPSAGGVPDLVRLFFIPSGVWGFTLRCLRPGEPWRAFLFSPCNGREIPLGILDAAPDGTARLPMARAPVFQDWVLVLEAAGFTSGKSPGTTAPAGHGPAKLPLE